MALWTAALAFQSSPSYEKGQGMVAPGNIDLAFQSSPSYEKGPATGIFQDALAKISIHTFVQKVTLLYRSDIQRFQYFNPHLRTKSDLVIKRQRRDLQ